MYNTRLLIVGVDLIPPNNEMLYNLVTSIIGGLDSSQYYVLSVQRKKEALYKNNLYTVRRNKLGFQFNSFIQGMKLLFKVFHIKLQFKPGAVLIIWSGFKYFDNILLMIFNLLKVEIIYTVNNEKQLEIIDFSLIDKIVAFNPEVKTRLEKNKKVKRVKFILPAIEIPSKRQNQKRKGLIFTTVPFGKAHLEKRGVYRLFDVCDRLKYQFPDMKITILNRWLEGKCLLEEIIEERNLSNVKLVNENVKDIFSYYARTRVILNFGIGNDVPLIPLSVVEAMGNGTPSIMLNNTWFSRLIDKSNAGILSKNSVNDIIDSITYLLLEYDQYSSNARVLHKKRFSYRNFTGDFIDFINEK